MNWIVDAPVAGSSVPVPPESTTFWSALPAVSVQWFAQVGVAPFFTIATLPAVAAYVGLRSVRRAGREVVAPADRRRRLHLAS